MFPPETLVQDLRYAVRMLARNPGFTIVAVGALAIGIGVNTAVFTAYKAMVARPLDAANPSEMVNVALTHPSGASVFNFSYPDYEEYRDSARSFSGVIAFATEQLRLSKAGEISNGQAGGSLLERLDQLSTRSKNAEFVSVFAVSENYFKVLGVAPLRGRNFDSMSSTELAATPTVLISENYWQRRFAGDPNILGKTIRVNAVDVIIGGITPHDFVGTGIAAPGFWLPMSLEPLVHDQENWLRDRENARYRLYARLAPGVSLSQAQGEMNLLTEHLRKLHKPDSGSTKPATAVVWPGSPFPLPLNRYPGLEFTILLIMIAAGMVLAVACANVSSLQLARAKSRESELRTRISLGASRGRVVRQLLTESSVLGSLAGVVAFFVTWVLLEVAVTAAAGALPIEYGKLVFNVSPDLQIFSYVFAISLAAGILFGLTPALESSGAAVSSGNRTSTSPVRSRRIRDLLITAQVAFSMVLVIAGSLLVRSSIQSLKMDTGYDEKRIAYLSFSFPEGTKYPEARRLDLVRELRSLVAEQPGVSAITSAQAPNGIILRTAAVLRNGSETAGQSLSSVLYYTYVEPNYFQTLGIPLKAGRIFQATTGSPEPAVILSESAAKQLSPQGSPIGRRVQLGLVDERNRNSNELTADGEVYQVIGVARDTRGFQFDGSDAKLIYLPLPQDKLASRPMLIRMHTDPAQMTRGLTSLITSIDPDLVVTAATLEETFRGTAPFVISSLAAAIAFTLGSLGLLLALMGIFGTVSYIVVLRTRELGIRIAVGAQKSHILTLILRESTRPVISGLCAGVGLALGASYLLRSVLYGLNAIDGIASFAAVSLLFIAFALIAAFPPALRALRIDPVVALRAD